MDLDPIRSVGRVRLRRHTAVIDPSNKPARSTRRIECAGEAWAYFALILANLALAPYHGLLVGRYIRAGARPRILEVPPLIWVPALLVPIAMVLGLIGMVT